VLVIPAALWRLGQEDGELKASLGTKQNRGSEIYTHIHTHIHTCISKILIEISGDYEIFIGRGWNRNLTEIGGSVFIGGSLNALGFCFASFYFF
jgi:hypothetical protein